MRLFALLLCWLATLPAFAQDVLPVPVLTASVIDTTGTLTPAQREALAHKQAAFESQAGPQIVVLMIPSTLPEDITSYAQRVADSWKLGRKDVGDGVLIVVAKKDRKVRIEVAKALEGAVPDLAARQIIQNAITPAFKAGDYAGGLNLAMDQLQARIRGENLPAPKARAARYESTDGGPDFGTMAGLFFIGVPIVGMILTAMMGRKLGSLATAGLAGGGGWMLGGASLWMGGLAALAALVLVGVMGIGAARRSSGMGNRLGNNIGRRSSGFNSGPVIWGGPSFGGGGGFSGGGDSGSSSSGYSSGGGGDFGGGGASGDW